MKTQFTYSHDCFMSYAHEDQHDFVAPLVAKLQKLGFVVWYDSESIHIGSPISEAIDQGLLCSRFIIVILSPNYITKHWPRVECQSALQIESSVGRDVVIPVWLDVEYQDILHFSPMIAGRLAVRGTKASVSDVAIEIAARMNCA